MKRFLSDDSGAAGVEYGILLAAISAGIVIVAFTMGSYVAGAFDTVEAEFVGSDITPRP